MVSVSKTDLKFEDVRTRRKNLIMIDLNLKKQEEMHLKKRT